MAPFGPYGLSLVCHTGRYTEVHLLCDQLGVPHETVTSLDAAVMPVAVVVDGERVSGPQLAAWCGNGRAAIVLADALPAARDVERRQTPYSRTGSCHAPFVYSQARRGAGLLLGVQTTDLQLMMEAVRAWNRMGVDANAGAIVPCTASDKYAVHRLFREVLTLAFAHQGLPLVHRWYFPGTARTHFNVRVDADWYDEGQWRETRKLLAPLAGSASWFITCRDLDRLPGVQAQQELGRLGCEIGSHGYHHYTFRDDANNQHNLRLAHACLLRLGVRCRAFVSPSAKWNAGLQRVVERLGYVYSSEFALAHDTYPFRPAVGGVRSGALQVPVHPTSPANFTKYSRASVPRPSILIYYRQVARLLYDSARPVHFYGHPADLPLLAGGGVLEEVLSWPDVSVSTLQQYADWWNTRASAYSVTVRRNGARHEFVPAGRQAGERSLAVSWDPDVVNLVPEGPFECGVRDLAAARTYTLRHRSLPVFQTVGRRLGLRGRVGDWLDYEKVVPSRDYRATTAKTAINALVKRLRGL
jgi:hypothetical protein